MNTITKNIDYNYHRLLDDINNCSSKVGRDSSLIRPVLVTKFQSVENINAAIKAGATYFAENYPEKLIPKLENVKSTPDVKWHMIGHIQSRKSILVAEHFDYVHSLDSSNLARRLNKTALEMNKKLPVLIEINSSGEDTKNGYLVNSHDTFLRFVDAVAEISSYHGLLVTGLMTMPPFTKKPEESRKYFSGLKILLERINESLPQLGLVELSMGTS